MEKIDLVKQFACRLKDAMITVGLGSQRSTSGVNIQKLAEISGHSVQICRRYLRGDAIPEPVKLIEIAKQLDVSPGWLLFGDYPDKALNNGSAIQINKKLLHYIFSRASTLYNTDGWQDEIPDFLMDLVHDVSQIQANEEQSRKIIDLALASARYFNQDERNKT